MRAYLRRYTLDNRRLVRGPSTRNARKVLAHLRRVERELARAGCDRPDDEAIARALGVDRRDVEDVRSVLGMRDVSASGEADDKPFELVCSDESPEELAAETETAQLGGELLRRALSGLDARLREVVEQRCLAPESRTLSEIGRELGVSHEAIRQMELRAKSDMRCAISAAMAARGLEAADLYGTSAAA
jgi:DNA-directed RNA polymerase sigma subunit (sigma70/sigma32)